MTRACYCWSYLRTNGLVCGSVTSWEVRCPRCWSLAMAAGSETGSGARTVDVSSLASSAGGARSEAFEPLSARTRRESLRCGLATAAAACSRCTGGVGSGSGSAGCDKSPGMGMPTERCPLWVVCDRRCPIYFRARPLAQTVSVHSGPVALAPSLSQPGAHLLPSPFRQPAMPTPIQAAHPPCSRNTAQHTLSLPYKQ